MIGLIFLAFSLVMFVISTLREPGRYNLIAAGLAFYVAYVMWTGHLWR